MTRVYELMAYRDRLGRPVVVNRTTGKRVYGGAPSADFEDALLMAGKYIDRDERIDLADAEPRWLTEPELDDDLVDNFRERCATILAHYGEPKQITKAVEELGELVAALARSANYNDTEVIDEIADVTIMLEQLTQNYGRDAVQERVAYKLRRTLAEIGGEE